VRRVAVLPVNKEVVIMQKTVALNKATVVAHRLHWDIKLKRVIDDLLSLRADLYMNVYEAPEKRVFDEMLAHALVWILREEAPPTSDRDEHVAGVLQKVMQITDDELFHFLYEVGAKPKHSVSISLVRDVAIGRPFQRFGELEFRLASCEKQKAELWIFLVNGQEKRRLFKRKYIKLVAACLESLKLTYLVVLYCRVYRPNLKMTRLTCMQSY
jgi:hypothetical protein